MSDILQKICAVKEQEVAAARAALSQPDLRAQAEAQPPARDFVGAVAMLRKRPDIDRHRIGAIGYSMGGNTLIYGIPRCQPIRAAIAVQPTSGTVFAPNLARTQLGPAGPLLARRRRKAA